MLLFALCIAYGMYLVATRPPTPITSPDTVAYVDASPLVPIGYPLILDAIGVDGAAVLQPLVFSVALAWLGVELCSLTGRIAVSLIVLIGIVLVPDTATYHASILSESLFMSGLVSFLAAVVRFTRAPSWQTVLAAATITGLTATIRRSAYAFVPVLLLMVLLRRRDISPSGWRALVALSPILLLAGTEYLVTMQMHGDARTSLTGRHLYAKAALIDAPAAPRPAADAIDARLNDQLEHAYQPIRDLLETAPGDLRPSLVLYYETCLQGPCVSELRDTLPLSEADKNARLARVGAARIFRAPENFIELTAVHYRSVWTAYKLQHPDTAQRLAAFLGAHRPLPFEKQAFKVAPTAPIEFTPSSAVRYLQPLVLAVGGFTLAVAIVGIVAAARGRASTLLLAATLASLTAHGVLLLSTVAAAGIARFMIGVFPAVVTATGLGLWAVAQKWLEPPERRTL